MSNTVRPGDQVVHIHGFGERERFAHIPCQLLAQGAVPAFHVIGLPAVFADTAMRLGRKNFLVRIPEIAEGVITAIRGGDFVPQPLAGGRAVIPDDKSDNLPGAPTQRGPEPVFGGFDGYK
jgi:hypothetical protein